MTENGQTTLDLFSQPAFKREADGWTSIDSTITTGSGDYPFEALGLANPVHFGLSADALVTIDTVSGPVIFGLEDATVNPPTLSDGVVTYVGVFPGVDLEFRTDGGRVGKHLVLADEHARSAFRFTLTDPEHTLGEPVEGRGESWSFSSAVAFGTGIELPAPAAWAKDGEGGGLPGSAHQHVSVTGDGYAIDLSVDPLWARTVSYPLVLDPAVQWTDETWGHGDGLAVAFASTGATDCDGEPCLLSDAVDGRVQLGHDRFSGLDYLAYIGTDVSALSDRQVVSAVLTGYGYWGVKGVLQPLCSDIGVGSTGLDQWSPREWCTGSSVIASL